MLPPNPAGAFEEIGFGGGSWRMVAGFPAVLEPLRQEVDFGLGQPINGLFDFHKGTHGLISKPRGNGVQG